MKHSIARYTEIIGWASVFCVMKSYIWNSMRYVSVLFISIAAKSSISPFHYIIVSKVN